ncbi:hypothetical protein, partial [Chromobacterium subtsugae]|uniref:hypothetical protein n=1 Tax=Chromobacterium subtsugae TaxID=251747 RepID=UPI001C101102
SYPPRARQSAAGALNSWNGNKIQRNQGFNPDAVDDRSLAFKDHNRSQPITTPPNTLNSQGSTDHNGSCRIMTAQQKPGIKPGTAQTYPVYHATDRCEDPNRQAWPKAHQND